MTKPGPKCRSLADRFWEKVDVRGPDECWPWKAGTNGKGYGRIHRGGARGPAGFYAHRVCWTLCFGPIPEGMDILHSCDNRPCCNPRDLFPGTNADNVADMVTKGRQARGEEHGCVKLTVAQVAEIRRAPGTQNTIAARFGISGSEVSHIKNRKRWNQTSPTTQQEKTS